MHRHRRRCLDRDEGCLECQIFGRGRNGSHLPPPAQIRTCGITKRMRATLKEIRAQLHKRRHEPVPVIGQWLSRLFRGYCNYYHVPGNTRRLDAFRREVIGAWRHALKRRSQRGHRSRAESVESAGCAGRTTQVTKACSFACAVSAQRDLSRTRQHPMPLRLPAPADRRGRQREAGLHAGRVHRRAARAWEMGLPAVRNTDPGTGAGPSNRQGHPDRRSAGSRDGGQIRRPLCVTNTTSVAEWRVVVLY